MHPISPTATGILLRVRVQPRASRTELAGLHGNAFKVRLTAPPTDGAANEALIGFLADRLGVARSSVSLVSGTGGRSKLVKVTGVSTDEARRRLELSP
jgi:uncharacterized protein